MSKLFRQIDLTLQPHLVLTDKSSHYANTACFPSNYHASIFREIKRYNAIHQTEGIVDEIWRSFPSHHVLGDDASDQAGGGFGGACVTY